MTDDEQFINRHGKSFSTAKIEADRLPSPDLKPRLPNLPRRKRSRVNVLLKHKKALIFTLLIVMAVPLAAGEYVRLRYAGEVVAARRELSSMFVSTVVQQKSGWSSVELTKYDQQLNTLNARLCSGGFFDNLAKLYERSKQAYADCNSYRGNVSLLEGYAREAAGQMAYLERLQPLLVGVAKSPDDQFAVLAAQQENWQAFVGNLQQLSVPSTFTNVHNELVKQSQAIRDLWIALVQASNSQDSGAFRAANAKLAAAYSGFQKQADVFYSALDENQAKISQTIAKL